MLKYKFTPIGDNSFEDYFSSIGMEELVLASKAEDRGVNDMIQETPYKPILRDLYRLHRLVRENKRMTVLEFGTGWSSLVLAHALDMNRREFFEEVSALRKSNKFEHHSLDDIEKWSKIANDRLTQFGLSNGCFHVSPVRVCETFGRLTTRYDKLPLVNPDFIYLDGPDQFEVKGEIRGLTTAHPDFMPMASDILLFEHFLVPGTIVLVDGRAANARFLSANLQRCWTYSYDADFDQHVFLLDEPPLGKHNRRQLEFYGFA
ncbi:hypothetical protein [uncultured Thalassospira sp.]|uniref:hypothetical protein n=1 Tax=uncultured Thalassospira sp. TaxID=404382 RepID=UPI0032B2EA3E